MAAKLKKGFYLWATALAGALLSLAFSIHTLRDTARAGKWPVVEGRILSSQYVLGCGRSGRDPFPEVQYEYFYAGQRIKGNRVAIDSDFCGWASQARSIVDSYKPGQKVPVHINPAQPHHSALLAGEPQTESVWLLVASFAGLLLAGYKTFSKVRGAA
jgi:Protein of unknown function (DUF3592)